MPADATLVPVLWTPFPLRIISFFADAQSNPRLSQDQIWQLADTGHVQTTDGGQWNLSGHPSQGRTLQVPQNVCPEIKWDGPYVPFFLGGPRGWQDEYFEWSVERRSDGKIQRVMFTCEDIEYYFALWRQNPERVLDLYRRHVSDRVALEDLCLRNAAAEPIVDPLTGRPAYDSVNRWNSGPVRTSEGGAAMHVTSAASQILDALINVAGGASVARSRASEKDGRTPQSMICCVKWGSPNRAAGPLIGLVINRAVEAGLRLTLQDPVGLYMQRPNFARYQTPDGSDPSRFFQVTRGELGDGTSGSDSILQAVFEVPEELGYTVSDLVVDGRKVTWGAQLVETMQMAIRRLAFPAEVDDRPRSCVGFLQGGEAQPYIQQLLPWDMLRVGSPQLLPIETSPGTTVQDLALLTQSLEEPFEIEFDVDGVEALDPVFVPSSELPQALAQVNVPANEVIAQQAIRFRLAVDESARPGPVNLRVRNLRGRLKDVPWSVGWLRILPGLLLFLTLFGDPSAQAQTTSQAASDPPPVLGSVLHPPTLDPHDATFFTPDVEGVPNTPSVNAYAWQTFIALSWPANPEEPGTPDRSVGARSFGDPESVRATTWESFRNVDTIFLPGAIRPLPWGEDPPPPRACSDAGAGAGDRILAATAKLSSERVGRQIPDSTAEATGGWLTDQKDRLVWFERLVNRDEFEYLLDQRLYDAGVQQAVAMRDGISFPFGESRYGTQGSIEIKAAWRQLDPAEVKSGRYHTVTAYLHEPGSGTCVASSVGLVGLHIIRKTPTFPSWSWATFEQVDNAPTAGADPTHPVPWSFFDPDCTAGAEPLRYVPNLLPDQGRSPAQDHPDGAIVIGTSRERPTQVLREFLIPREVEALNEAVQAQIAAANAISVWRHYRLVNVQWPVDSLQDAQFTAPKTEAPLPTYFMTSTGPATPVANVTLETYAQQKNCTDCHAQATVAAPTVGGTSSLASDFSYLLLSADYPQDAPSSSRPNRTSSMQPSHGRRP